MKATEKETNYKNGYGDGLERGLAEGRLEERERITKMLKQWFNDGCPGLDRERFVAFGPLGMRGAMRDAIASLILMKSFDDPLEKDEK